MTIAPSIQRALLGATSMILLALSAKADRVERRGGEPTLHGQVILIDDAGVRIQSDLGAEHMVPWDRVRSVEAADRQRDIDRWSERAMMLWRARARVERNDPTLAEPLFERLFEQYRGKTHETALVVVEGLLRCRLARGANGAALLPALEAVRLRRSGVTTKSYNQLPAVFDTEHALCTLLPPYWLDSPVLTRVLNEVAEYDAHGDEVVQAIARLYAESLHRQVRANQPTPLETSAELPDHPGVQLLARLLELGGDDATARDAARSRLLREQERSPRFVKAWTRFFTGVSLINESGVGRKQRGMMHLLYLPALYGSEQKYLSGVALRLTSEVLETHGNAIGAERLRLELAARFPNHPIRDVERARLGLNLETTTSQKEQG